MNGQKDLAILHLRSYSPNPRPDWILDKWQSLSSFTRQEQRSTSWLRGIGSTERPFWLISNVREYVEDAHGSNGSI
jgi:hypothetical protein